MNKILKVSDISIVLHTLNDAHRDLDLMFQSIIANGIVELIVVDGGSTDGTFEIAKKYTTNIFSTKPGICSQHLYGLSKVTKNYVLAAETDHIYPEGLFFSLLESLVNSNYSGIQAYLKCDLKSNIFERGQIILYELSQKPGTLLDVPTGPTVWHFEPYFQAITTINKLEGAAGFSVDTFLADYLRLHKMHVLMVKDFAIQHEALDLKKFFRKIKSYGKGDYNYYIANKASWDFKRKLRSLTHVLNRYGLHIPLKSLFLYGFTSFILFCYIIVIFRYYGFFSELVENFLKSDKTSNN
jgi:glycosyltransferase involved in cell wall biosynthesis